MVRRRALSSKEISACTMLVLERNQSWGPLLILFLFFWGFRSFPFIYLHSTGNTHYTNKVFFFSKTVFLPGKPITYVHYIFSPFFDVICTFMFQKVMSRHCFICLVLFLDLSIPVPMLTISYQILYCQSVNQVHTVWHSRLWSFQGRDTKLKRFLAKNQLYSNEITKFWELE